jgi:hypothetical protein
MGYMSADNINIGGITINSTLNKDHEGLAWGDGPSDEMDICIENIIKVYEKDWLRKPYMEELILHFDFCFSPLDEDGLEWKDKNNKKQWRGKL